MQVNIRAVWKGQSKKEVHVQRLHRDHSNFGKLGCIYEEFEGVSSATGHLCSEAFASKMSGCAEIPASRLRKRLPKTLRLVEEIEIIVNCSEHAWIETVQQSYREFVELCARKEKETGEPVLICVD